MWRNNIHSILLHIAFTNAIELTTTKNIHLEQRKQNHGSLIKEIKERCLTLSHRCWHIWTDSGGKKTFGRIIVIRFINFVYHVSSAQRRKIGKSRNWISHLLGYGRCFLNLFKLIHYQHIISYYTVCVPGNSLAK
jgi:hypothetical protein